MTSKHGHGEQLQLAGTKGTLFRDDPTHPVYIMPDGQFGIKWGSVFVKRRTLLALDKFISEQVGRKALKAFRDGDKKPSLIVKMDRDKVYFADGTSAQSRYYQTWYLENPEVQKKIAELDKEEEVVEMQLKELRAKRQKLVNKLVEVDRGNFDQFLSVHGVSTKTQ